MLRNCRNSSIAMLLSISIYQNIKTLAEDISQCTDLRRDACESVEDADKQPLGSTCTLVLFTLEIPGHTLGPGRRPVNVRRHKLVKSNVDEK